MSLMHVFCAENNVTVLECDVVDLGLGAGRIKCLECGGHGDARKIWGDHAEAFTGPDAKAFAFKTKCLDCKGTGWQLVSV